MDPAWAALAAVASPLVLVILNGWQQRKSDRENWRRQDEVAARAAEVATAVVATGRTLRANQRQLEEIHTLVSSELSEAQQRELAAVEELLARSREVVELKRSMGVEPTVADEDALLELEIRIEAMTRSLAVREPAAVEYPSRLGP